LIISAWLFVLYLLPFSATMAAAAATSELLRRGADPHALDRWGLTAHTSAIKGKHASTAEELANWMLNEPESPRSPGSHCSDRSRRSFSTGSRRGSYEHRLNLQRQGSHSPRRSSPRPAPSSLLSILVVDTDVNAAQEAALKIPLLSASAMSDHEPATFGRKMEEVDGSRNYPLTPELLNLAALESLPSVEMMSVDARALITASDCGDLNEIIKLVSKGACIDQADYDGRTSAHLASSNGHIDVVRYLIQNNASLDVFDRFGRTPLQGECGWLGWVCWVCFYFLPGLLVPRQPFFFFSFLFFSCFCC
jgi:hypothetical protein